MKKLATLLMGLILATPLQAAPTKAQPVRSRYVYTFAYEGCPKAAQIRRTASDNKSMQFLDNVIKGAKMNHAEGDLLVFMCFVYDRGARDGAQPPTQ